MTTEVSREQVLWYRTRQQGLLRESEHPEVLELGLQDSPAGVARLALAARTTGEADLSGFDLAWTLRGAPYFHRPGELARLAAELWPWSEADAQARLLWPRSRTSTGGLTPLATYRLLAESLRSIVVGPMTKGAASAALTKLVPPEQTRWCPGCKSQHVYEQPFRLAALPAGLGIEPGESPLTLVHAHNAKGVPEQSAGAERLMRAYLRFLGPATPTEVAKWLDTSAAEVRGRWPQGLAEVRVDGRKCWLPSDRLDDLVSAQPPELVRLLPTSDPFLQARDRAVVLPHKEQQKTLWTILGSPGAVLVDGEVLGVWRAKLGRKDRLDVTITQFGELDPPAREAARAEAERVAGVRGVPSVSVSFS
ncbi:DNA glycosylase AlkZ-like family protein [Kutzneria albida]|uniref:Winged helix DNA-binding domain-containing protein n=1 Tax=Kutzneria albida DSM 43870 TaxID=1449976 RepID=W5W9F9_9PSEU|nr:crosslink repair DNA glycosylase YcaQ family protein [Kutzneria albida]AHH94834.1 hypothetical protein KALB_1461 [Kutzneria albida DSM 43870]